MLFVGCRMVIERIAPLLRMGIGMWVVAITTTEEVLESGVTKGAVAVVVLAAIELVITELGITGLVVLESFVG